jgi:hypothetical protein
MFISKPISLFHRERIVFCLESKIRFFIRQEWGSIVFADKIPLSQRQQPAKNRFVENRQLFIEKSPREKC